MISSLIWSSSAQKKVHNIVHYISKRNQKAALRVLLYIESRANDLLLFPELGTIHTKTIRKLVLHRYPYTLYYTLDNHHCIILDVSHHSQFL